MSRNESGVPEEVKEYNSASSRKSTISKIQQYINENSIKPRDCLFHTQRSAKNSKGQMTGKIRVLARKDGIAMAESTCPECSHTAYAEQEWKRPFYVKCEKCS